MRYSAVENFIHTGIQTQITTDVQTHCLLVALINVVFNVDLHPAFKLWLLLLPIPYIADFQIWLYIVTDCEHLTAVKNEFMKNKQ